MPFYELNLILRPLPKQELVDCLKRTASLLWREEAVLKRVEFLGFKKLPYLAKGTDEGSRYSEANYFIYHLSVPFIKLKLIRPELLLETDLLRFQFFESNKSRVPEDYECTLEEELLPPAYRPSVQPLISDKNVLAVPRREHQIQNNKVNLIG